MLKNEIQTDLQVKSCKRSLIKKDPTEGVIDFAGVFLAG